MTSTNLRTTSLVIVTILCLLILCILLTSCSNKKVAFNSSVEAFGFAGATTGALLIKYDTQVSNLQSSYVISSEQQQYVNTLDKYISVFDSVVGENAIVSNKTAIDENDYNFAITTTVTDLNGNKNSITMKLFEIKEDNTPVLETDNDDINSSFNGTMSYADKEYTISGSKTFDNGNMQTLFTTYIDDANYVTCVQDNSTRTATYSVYKNNALIDSIMIGYKFDNNELTLALNTTNNGNQITYQLEREGNQLKVTYEDSSQNGVIYCTVSNDGTQITYTFDDNTNITKITQ